MILAEARDVVKVYRSKQFGRKAHLLRAVDQVSLTIEKGSCTALVGESGCGKSTLGKLLIGFEKPSGGGILFDGKTHTGLSSDREARKKIQMVSQDSVEAVNPRLTAEQIIGEPLKNYFGLKGEECRRRVDELLNQVGIAPQERSKYPRQFSGGQLQRICIARALAAEPELIILDEPLSSLDVSVQAQILNLLADLKQKHHLSYLLISHDLEAVYYLADVIYIMYRGQIAEVLGRFGDFEHLVHPYSRKLLFSDLAAMPDDMSAGEMTQREQQETGCSYCAMCPERTERCRIERPQRRVIGDKHWIYCHMK